MACFFWESIEEMNTISSVILSLPCLVAFFWAVLLCCNRRENTRSQNIWTLCLCVIGVCGFIWSDFFGTIEDYFLYYKLDIADAFFSLLIFPLVYLYFWSLTSSGKPTWKQYIWFVPAFGIGGISACLYRLLGEEQSADLIQKIIESRETYQFEPGSLQHLLFFIGWDVFYFILFLQAIVIMTYSTRNVIRYRRGLKSFFSNLGEKSIENNLVVLIGLYVLLFLAFVILFSRILSPEKYFSVKYFFSFTTGVTIYYMSYYVFRIKFTAADLIPEMENAARESINPGEMDEVYRKILPQFIELIDEEKSFLQPNLSLDDIARALNSNRTYVSRIINEEFQCNFYDYINGKRIGYAKALMQQNPMFSQEQIAKESGFLYGSNFSRTFKKQTGMTCREWLKEKKNQEQTEKNTAL